MGKESLRAFRGRTALTKLGYREMQPGVWGKPFAYQLLLARKVGQRWKVANYFKGADGTTHCWQSAFFTDEDSLKCAEQTIIKTINNGIPSDFGFTTVVETFTELL